MLPFSALSDCLLHDLRELHCWYYSDFERLWWHCGVGLSENSGLPAAGSVPAHHSIKSYCWAKHGEKMLEGLFNLPLTIMSQKFQCWCLMPTTPSRGPIDSTLRPSSSSPCLFSKSSYVFFKISIVSISRPVSFWERGTSNDSHSWCLVWHYVWC